MKRGIKILDYFFLLRPTLLIPVWTVYLGGFWAQTRFGTGNAEMSLADALRYDYLVAGVLLTLCMGATFVINQLSDVRSDSYNNKLFLIASGDVGKNAAVIETIVLAVPTIALGFILKPLLGFTLLTCFLIAGVMYSCKPLMCKDRPLAGFICNGAAALTVFLTGWSVRGNFEGIAFLQALPYIFALWSLYFFTTLPDIEGDKKADKITVGVKYGVKNCSRFALVCNILTIASALVLEEYYILAPALLALPFFAHAAVRGTINDAVRTTKMGLLFVALVFCYKFPGLLLLLLFVFFFSKWYYKIRFGIAYPSFETR
jgi:4-hydroxybenzoate polyprenyltransferase